MLIFVNKKAIIKQWGGYEKYFIPNAENFYNIPIKYGIDPRFIFCIAIHESGFGTSAIANEKGNFFGWNANDSNPYGDASTFVNMSAGIEQVSSFLAKNYISSSGMFYQAIIDNSYNPSTIQGIGSIYASDPNWANAIMQHAKNIFDYAFSSGTGTDIIEFAMQYLGYSESQMYPILGISYPWCAYFATWCYRECGYVPSAIDQIYDVCSAIMNNGKRKNAWYPKNTGYIPMPGDFIIISNSSRWSR